MKLNCREGIESLGPVWEALGKSLQEVEIWSSCSTWKLDLYKLRNNCRNISRLSLLLWAIWGVSQEIEALCTSYGENLLRLQLVLDDVGRPALSRIAVARPNAQMDFVRHLSTDTTIFLEKSAVSWKVHFRDQSYNQDSLRRVGNSCPSLQECILHLARKLPFSRSAFCRLFEVPKSMLRSFDVRAPNMACISTILEVLTVKANSLEKFSYIVQCPPLEHLRSFVHSQKELKIVRFTSRGQRFRCFGDVTLMPEKGMGPVLGSNCICALGKQ